MKTDEVKDLLKISKQIRIDRVIPKTEFFRALDKPDQKNLIRDNLNKLHWLASMKPENTNIPASETFQEVEIFSAEIKDIKNAAKVFNIVNNKIPYPLFFVLSDNKYNVVCTADYEKKQNGYLRVTKIYTSPALDNQTFSSKFKNFDWRQLSTVNMGSFYASLSRFVMLTNLETERQFKSDADPWQAMYLKQEIESLTAEAKKVDQLNQRMRLLNQIKTKRKMLEEMYQGENS